MEHCGSMKSVSGIYMANQLKKTSGWLYNALVFGLYYNA